MALINHIKVLNLPIEGSSFVPVGSQEKIRSLQVVELEGFVVLLVCISFPVKFIYSIEFQLARGSSTLR